MSPSNLADIFDNKGTTIKIYPVFNKKYHIQVLEAATMSEWMQKQWLSLWQSLKIIKEFVRQRYKAINCIK